MRWLLHFEMWLEPQNLVGGYGDDPEGAGGLIEDAERVLAELRRGGLAGIAPADEIGASAGASDHEVDPGGVLLVPEEPRVGGGLVFRRRRRGGGEGVVAGGEVGDRGGRGGGSAACAGGVDGDVESGFDGGLDVGGGLGSPTLLGVLLLPLGCVGLEVRRW